MRKTACLLIALLFMQILPIPSLAEEQATLKWPEYQAYPPESLYVDDLKILFRPIDDYSCEQNPPDFSWHKVNSAVSYDVIVCRDEALTDVVCEKTGLENPFYNFSEPFEPGTYYWSVRFHTESGLSVWQPARRFLIEDDAFLFPVKEMPEVLENAKATGHPRYYTTRKNLSAFRANAKSGDLQQKVQAAYESAIASMSMPDFNYEKTYVYGEGGTALRNLFWKEVYSGHDRLHPITLAYVATGERKIGEHGVDLLMKMTKFTLPPWDENTDTYLCFYAMYMSIFYDSLYDLLTPEQRTTVLDKISEAIHKADTKLFILDSFTQNPRASHEWNCGRYLLAATMLTVGEIEIAEERAKFLLPYYINQISPHQVEDGGFRGGTGYWRYHNAVMMEEYLRRSGVINVFDKAYYKNQLYFGLYMLPAGAPTGAFGDDGTVAPDYYVSTIYNTQLNRQKNPIAKWGIEQLGSKPLNNPETFDYESFPDMEATAPLQLANAKCFRDSGYAALHSDLIDKNRVSLYFQSGWLGGTYGHQHPDQNGFILNAYGEKLAINSGFYPYYMSPHHKNYSSKTYANNTITYNGGKGQPLQDGTAKGLITGFVTHNDFDYVAGDATKAYKEARGGTIPEALEKVKRHILYLRPDLFIFVDDLAAKKGEEASFEFWLHADEDLKVYEDRKGARITKGDAVLDASVHYPKAVSAKYISGFAGPDLVQYPKEVDGDTTNTPDPNQPKQQRVYFATKPANQTKIITTLDVHKADESVVNMRSETFDQYVKLSFGDGSIAYINLTDGKTVTADNIQFNGVAVLKNENSTMLAEGTQLIVDGKTIFESTTPVTVVLGKGELSISNMDEDANLKVYLPGLTDVTELKNEKIRTLEQGKTRNGVTWTADGDYADFQLYCGARHFYLNDRKVPGTSAGTSVLRLSVDGTETEFPVRNYYDHEGNVVGNVSVKGLDGLYRVEEENGIALNAMEQLVSFSGDMTFMTNSSAPYAKLHKLEKTEVTLNDDFDQAKADSAAYVEAEDYQTLNAVSTVTKESIERYSFLSGGTVLQNLSQTGDMATYRIEVPYDGEFDLMLNNVVYNAEKDSNMCVIMEDQTVLFTMPVTNGPNGPNIQKGTSVWGVYPVDWHVCRVRAKMKLNKGVHTLKLLGMGGGLTKIDWIGLIDSAK